jgi:hypothetical protein
MTRKLVAAAIVVILVAVVIQQRSQPDFDKSVERTAELHADTVEVVAAVFGPPSNAQRYFSGASCGGLSGPSGKELLVLGAEWELTSFEEERVTDLLDEVQAFLTEQEDLGGPLRSTVMSGGFHLAARGTLARVAVAGPVARDAARFTLTVFTRSVCGNPGS